MLCAPPESITSALAAADDLGRFADRLAAGGTRGQAIEIRTLSVVHAGDVAGGHVRFLFQLEQRIERVETDAGELRHVETVFGQRGGHHLRKCEEILAPFA